MPQSLNLQIKGLHTSNSDISGVPPGSLSIANNLDLTKLNLAQCRRGFDLLGTGLPDSSYRASRLFDYASYIFAVYNSTLNYYSSGWNSNGSLIKPANALVSRFSTLSQNLYLTSSTGIRKLDSATGTIYAAGIPNALDMVLSEDRAHIAWVYLVKSGVNRAQINKVKGIGPISNNSLPFYAGRWIDPITNKIRILPKASSKYFGLYSI
jgi:hypothetical protein